MEAKLLQAIQMQWIWW